MRIGSWGREGTGRHQAPDNAYSQELRTCEKRLPSARIVGGAVAPRQAADRGWYPAVMRAVDGVTRGARQTLGESLTGVYLHGSLATGDFNPDRSDIDMAVVTSEMPTAAQIADVRAMHQALAGDDPRWGAALEVVYVPADELRRAVPSERPFPAVHTDDGFEVKPLGPDFVIQRHVLREYGKRIVGPPPRTLIDAVTPRALRAAQVGNLHEWWEPQLRDVSRLRDRAQQSHAVLTMCRALYMLDSSAVASKPAAARWAQQRLGDRWAAFIERALAWPRGAQDDELTATLDFIGYTLAQADGG